MDNIFRGAYFGKRYWTRSGHGAIWVEDSDLLNGPENPVTLILDTGELIGVSRTGRLLEDTESEEDIIQEVPAEVPADSQWWRPGTKKVETEIKEKGQESPLVTSWTGPVDEPFDPVEFWGLLGEEIDWRVDSKV